MLIRFFALSESDALDSWRLLLARGVFVLGMFCFGSLSFAPFFLKPRSCGHGGFGNEMASETFAFEGGKFCGQQPS